MIPTQLKQGRFNRVIFKEKKAFEKGWQNKPYSYNEIKKFFPKENYGVMCGGECRVLDDDTKDNKLLNLFLDNFGKTFRVRDHLYFTFSNGEGKKIIFFDGQNHLGELQGEGSYVVGAGSTHPTGELYKVKEDIEMKVISYDKFVEVFKDYLHSNGAELELAKIELTEEDNKFIQDIKSKWKEGDRQNLTLSLTGYLRKNKGFGFDRCSNIVKTICEEMKDSDVIERLNAVKATFMKDENEIKGVTGLKEREINLDDDINNFLIMTEDKNGKIKKTVDIDKVALHLVNKNHFKTIFGQKLDKIYNYDGKIYKRKAKGIIKAECEKILKKYSKNNAVLEIFEKIKRLTKIDLEEFEQPKNNLIPLRNGVYNLDTKKLEQHSHINNFTFLIDIEFNKKIDCPIFKKYIDETLYPEDINLAQEWLGFLLYRQYFVKKGLICVGDQDTGKSVFLDTCINLVGEKNKSGLPLQKITGGTDFNKLALKDKHLNCFDDLSSQDINDGGSFKVATGGGWISAEEKFGDNVEFKCYAKQLFATNKIPPVKDNDDLAYFGRWLILRFDNVPDKIDFRLREKIHTEEERTGLLNWALEGLQRLLENGEFSYKFSSEENKRIMEISGCPLVAFVDDCLEKSETSIITKEEMFKLYSFWCEENKRPRLTKEMLGRQLTKYCNYIYPEKRKERIWVNAKIKQQYVDTYDTFKNNMRDFSEESINNKNKGYKNVIYNNLESVASATSTAQKNEKEQNFKEPPTELDKIEVEKV